MLHSAHHSFPHAFPWFIPERLELIFDGVSSYSASTAGLKEVTEPDAASSSSSTSTSGGALPSEFSALADTLADALLTSEPTPVQTLLLDQLAKVTAALGRQAFSVARQQSGPLGALVNAPIPGLGSSSSSGNNNEGAGNAPRSLLGALIDPLGLFRGSGVVDMDAQDEQALAAAAKLSELLAASPYATQAQSLTPQDLLAVVQEVAPRLWARRLGVAQASGRFAGVLLEQQARRLEKRRNPTPPTGAGAMASSATTATTSATATAATRGSTGASAAAATPRPSTAVEQPSAPSPRLAKARLLLAEN